MLNKSLGKLLKDNQLGLFEVRDADFLQHCRDVAEQIARINGEVSINDVRAAVPVPAEMHPSVLGAVFRCKKFQAVGFTEATHAAAHARVVRVYKLAEAH